MASLPANQKDWTIADWMVAFRRLGTPLTISEKLTMDGSVEHKAAVSPGKDLQLALAFREWFVGKKIVRSDRQTGYTFYPVNMNILPELYDRIATYRYNGETAIGLIKPKRRKAA